MAPTEPFSYDRVHYPANPYRVTRPDHLELLGRLHGMAPRAADEARVLELGCGTGENLILAADCFPRARFVGIDLAASQIEVGRRLVAATGAAGVELRAFDLTRIDDSFGEFDYIVAHGVYSWVPEPVREALLEVIRQRLAPHGVAFVSHNVKPGYFGKAMAREMMRYGIRSVGEPAERVDAARAFLEEVLARANPTDKLYRATLAERLEQARKRDDDVLYHDDLSDICDGCWFWELAERLDAHGLQFVADAAVENLGTTGLAREAIAAVEARAANVVEREQLLDYLRNRSLRLTLACHASVMLDRELRAASIVGLHAALDPAVEEIAMDPKSPASPLTIRTQSTRLRVEEPLAKAVLVALGRVWPGSLPVPEVAQRVGPGATVAEVAARLLDQLRNGFVALSLRPPCLVTVPSERPRGCALARVQAEASEHVVNLRHTYSLLDETGRRVLRALDGTKDRAALSAELGLDAAVLDAALVRLGHLALLRE